MIFIADSISKESLAQVAPILFFVFAALTVISAWSVVFSQSIVRMSFNLLLTLGGVAALYFMMEAEFLAAIQLIVYAGGILILIIFGIMLTSSNPFKRISTTGWDRFMGIGLGIATGGLLLLALVRSTIAPDQGGHASNSSVADIGHALLSSHIAPFEISAVLLLVVMIGAAYIARQRSKN